MADTAIRVFVDEAVRGDFPPLCARTGRPTRSFVIVERSMGGLPGWAFLLAVFGPPAWVALVVWAAFAGRRERLTIRLPYHPDAYRRERELAWWPVGLGAVGAGVLLMALTGRQPALALIGLVAIGVAVALRIYTSCTDVGVELDASRRWVTIWRLHPGFVAATLASPASGSQPFGRFSRASS